MLIKIYINALRTPTSVAEQLIAKVLQANDECPRLDIRKGNK